MGLKTPKASSWQGQVFLMELRKLIAYRVDFWVNFIGQIFLSLTIAYFLWLSIFQSSGTTEINGKNIQYMIFYYLIVPLIFRVQQGQGIGYFSRDIYEGTLSKYLLYPMNVFKFKLSTYGANSFFFLLQLFLVLIIYNIFFYDPAIYQFSILNLLAFILAIFVATLSFFYYFTIGELLAFWFDNTWSIGVISRFITSFFGGVYIPLSFFPEWSQSLLKYTPFPYMIDFPLQALVGALSLQEFGFQLFISIAWMLAFKFLCMSIWLKGQYKYSGVGI